jgi:hypothetical protein
MTLKYQHIRLIIHLHFVNKYLKEFDSPALSRCHVQSNRRIYNMGRLESS